MRQICHNVEYEQESGKMWVTDYRLCRLVNRHVRSYTEDGELHAFQPGEESVFQVPENIIQKIEESLIRKLSRM